MENDTELSCKGRLRDSGNFSHIIESANNREQKQTVEYISWKPYDNTLLQRKIPSGVNRSLSSQVMEYYHKYSRNSKPDQFFPLPSTSTSSDGVGLNCSHYTLNPKLSINGQSYRDSKLKSYVSKERRKWVRLPLMSQLSDNDNASEMYTCPSSDSRSLSPEVKKTTSKTIAEERSESEETILDNTERKAPSPTSSVASHKPLEWDSGADVGYFATTPMNKSDRKEMSTIERIALARGCSAALKLSTDSRIIQKVKDCPKTFINPDANSTAITMNISGSGSGIEIPHIVKEQNIRELSQQVNDSRTMEQMCQIPESPLFSKVSPIIYPTLYTEIESINRDVPSYPLKKSSSMRVLTTPAVKLNLERSQSDLNIHIKDKHKVSPRLIFNSTSSLVTVVNKPITCDKVIQTTSNHYNKESLGVQVSDIEEKSPIAMRAVSLNRKSLQSILKFSGCTYEVESKKNKLSQNSSYSDCEQNVKNEIVKSSLKSSATDSPSDTQPNEAEHITSKSNSFEYFPGHIYKNVPNGNAEHVSSIYTGRSTSTMPNTSPSVEEKLWGQSDSLVRDLERSVNILKSLVKAKKCDKDMKKRLVHHVVKRLVSSKYTDDEIGHNLEENVPWNPDDARKKMYRTKIIQALAKEQNTTDSSDEWKLQEKKAGFSKKAAEGLLKAPEEMFRQGLLSSSEEFDQNTDRAKMDGREARMGLRSDDCNRSNNTSTEYDESGSSECFMPWRKKLEEAEGKFCMKKRCQVPHRKATNNTLFFGGNRFLFKNSINQGLNSLNWRLPATYSERQFEVERCSDSDSRESKLISYVEMEKRNHLIWITNEIRHLSNLKKLLEQPEKWNRIISTPKKPKPGLYKQWSSHCNLASPQNVDSFAKGSKYIEKRNSFTQTAKNLDEILSKTGGVIITGSCQSVEMSNVCIQTQEFSSILNGFQSPIDTCICSLHHCQIQSRVCRCPKITSETLKHEIRSPQVCINQKKSQNSLKSHDIRNLYQKDDRHVISMPITSNLNDFPKLSFEKASIIEHDSVQKDTKNYTNVTKSKLTYSCKSKSEPPPQDNCKCVLEKRQGRTEKSKEDRSEICEVCNKRTERVNHCSPIFHCECLGNYSHENAESNQQLRVTCHHSEIPGNSYILSSKHDCMTQKDDFSDDCNRKLENAEVEDCIHCGKMNDDQTVCESAFTQQSEFLLLEEPIRSHGPNNPHEENNFRKRKEKSDRNCECDKDCGCSNKKANDGAKFIKENRKMRVDSRKYEKLKTPEKTCRCCRICGALYQINRRCGCKTSYPEPVSYELSFVRESKRGNDNSNSENVAGKVILPSLPRIAGSGGSINVKQRQLSKSGEKRITLQEYLAFNKPRLMDNIEARRQYLNEITQLRELRRQKRLQLLTIASSLNILEPPKLYEITKEVKKTDGALKEKLRKRYGRLNEVRQKKRQRQKEEELRRNKLMAKIYGKKLQQKVLRGEMDLSHSASVISNL